MSDPLDEAQQKETVERDASIARARAALAQGEAETECIDCGRAIPEARRRAVPNVKRCVDCQEEFEGAR